MKPSDYKIITVNSKNIQNEHICCAIGNDKENQERANRKKDWIINRFDEGYVFKKFDVRGKVFIEYIPAENAWAPIVAPGYVYIDCFWVSGKFKGHGFGSKLLEEAEKDAANKNGLVILASKKKMPFLADKKYLLKKGFEVCNTAPPYFELLVKQFNKDAALPEFRLSVKSGICNEKEGLVFYFSNHCPFTEPWIHRIANYAEGKGFNTKVIELKSKEEAQNLPTPFSTCSIFYKGQFVTHELMVESKFDKILENLS